ncbi:GH32 C-terminal domain-containing protein [Salimicrobium salexigens]|uniref:GH32 C-terminal domain-containing protein n=1 Tax=Salimicrobium salexigens TaxID=908941 RepID=UPI001356325F|nr:GH32 C-terminal domain-containing protein [Salimicrobium salexigens]
MDALGEWCWIVGSQGIQVFSEHFNTEQSASVGDMDRVELQVIVDASSVEVFVNGGECALTSLIYPDGGCRGVFWFAEGGCVSVRSSVGVGK